MRTAALICLLLAALACIASSAAASSDGVLAQRETNPRRLLTLTGATPGGPLEAGTTSHRKLSGYVTWSISDCDIVSGNTIHCKSGYAVACCNTRVCTSNPDGSGGTCASDTILGCCGKKK